MARGFRNLADLDRELPRHGLALLGANAQGKTNLLEAVYYPVLFRSVRGATDADVARFNGPGFHVEAHLAGAGAETLAVTFPFAGKRKRITVDSAERSRLAAAGQWIAVAFLPADVGLASGGAGERRAYLDRLLALSDARYLRALSRYRAALAQRNAALRQRQVGLARAFDAPLAEAGAEIVRTREQWAKPAAVMFAAELDGLGEREAGTLRHRGRAELGDAMAWRAALDAALPNDRARGMTTIGPHRDDLILEIGGRSVREYGSTGQQRSTAIALKLIELVSLGTARGTEPALLLDDVFSELDRDRQIRLARRLLNADRQVFLTAPRRDELPPELPLPIWEVCDGRVAEELHG